MPPAEAPTPARIVFDALGIPRSIDFGDVYHSVDGGPEQARHVFLAGNGLPRRWRGRRRFAILETGFGLGLNFLTTASEFLSDPEAPTRLNYVAVEKHPPRPGDLERAHSGWPLPSELARELRRDWPPLVRGFHRLHLARGRIALTLIFADAAEALAELDQACVDAIYLDGFAPEKNPGMWSEPVYRQLARASLPGATAATWSVAAAVRAGLQAAGFQVEKRPGFGRKRQMLAAMRASGGTGPTVPDRRHAVVIGAGLAGCWTAHALARRGWDVEVVERHAQPAQEASGNSVGALLPAINLADNANARLARAAFLYATRLLKQEPACRGACGLTGLLQLAMTAQQAERMARIVATHAFGAEYVRWLERDEAARLAEHRVGGPGWWIPGGGWVEPQRLCRSLLDAVADRLELRFGAEAHRIAPGSRGWRILGTRGEIIAEAPTVVLANAYGARQLGIAGLPKLIGVRGQVSHLPPSPERSLRIVVCGDGYVAPLPGGGHCVGATFEPDSNALDLRIEDHRQNLARAERMLPGYGAGIDPVGLAGRAGVRTATADRLPACGTVTHVQSEATAAGGLTLLAGLGARGLIWAPLCAELLASRLDAEPNPVEASLVAAVDPNRFGRRVPQPE